MMGDNGVAVKAREAEDRFQERMDDDLNAADALAVLFDLVKDINTLSPESCKSALEETAEVFDRLTGVLGILYNRKETSVPKKILSLVEERDAARAEKNWARADEIREELDAKGYVVEDTPAGPKVSKK